MANTALSALIAKIRQITARKSPLRMTDAEIVDYVNLYYTSDFPQECKLFDFKQDYEFFTQPNVATYALSASEVNLYTSFQPPCYCSGYEMQYVQEKTAFYRYWPQLYTQQVIAVSTGFLGPYTGTISGVPIMAGTVLITCLAASGSMLIATDTGNGNGTGNLVDANDIVVGTIQYQTGLVNITWVGVDVPVLGADITAKYTVYQASRPNSILFAQNEFTLRPIPDSAYKISIQAYVQPFPSGGVVGDEFTTANLAAKPLLDNYFQLLAYGASLKIFADSSEVDNYKNVRSLYEEQLLFAQRKTLAQISTQRTSTIYSDSDFSGINRYRTF